MEITWLGHSSFLIKDSKGRTLLTDPFDETVGYPIFEGKCDVATISHQHFDHNYIKKLENTAEIIHKVGSFYAHDIPITGIPSYHDKEKGAKRGENTIYIFEMDGYRLCHLGDLGHLLSKDDLNNIGSIDVLFIPVGGNFTINGKEASDLCHSINPHIVIPMHYKTSQLTFPLDGVETFLKYMKNGEKINNHTLKLEGELKGNNQVKLLEYR